MSRTARDSRATWDRRDLLSLSQLGRADLEEILTLSAGFARRHRGAELAGRTVLTLFYEPSTRTVNSFLMAAQRLGAHTLQVAEEGSSAVKGESLRDTARTCQALGVDVVVVRHASSGVPHYLAERLDIPVINAGDGMHEHPTQGLLDCYTIWRARGRVEGLTVAMVGDIRHSRVARSDIWALSTLGAEVRVAAPGTLLPPGIEDWPVKVCRRLEDALGGADVVMALRLQRERMADKLLPDLAEYRRFWGIDRERLRLAAPDALIMHPGPVNRGVEIESELADSPASVIDTQVTNGVAVRMAVLYLLLGVEHDA